MKLGLGIEARGRYLLAHQKSAFDEWDASLTLRLDPGEDKRGLRAGAGAGGVRRRLWHSDARGAGVTDDLRRPVDDGAAQSRRPVGRTHRTRRVGGSERRGQTHRTGRHCRASSRPSTATSAGNPSPSLYPSFVGATHASLLHPLSRRHPRITSGAGSCPPPRFLSLRCTEHVDGSKGEATVGFVSTFRQTQSTAGSTNLGMERSLSVRRLEPTERSKGRGQYLSAWDSPRPAPTHSPGRGRDRASDATGLCAATDDLRE